MVAKFVFLVVSALAAATGVTSSPLPSNDAIGLPQSSFSFNQWGGVSSLTRFDDFYGVDNFDGSRCEQIVIAPQLRLVCRPQTIGIVQQRLLVLQEVAKRLIAENICDVEAQTIVFEQWHASLQGFSRDLRRVSRKQVGFDQVIFSHFNQLFNTDGTFSTHDLGFSGRDFGRNIVIVNGHLWDETKSFVRVGAAFRATRDATQALH